jgi:hypothetical protein
MPRRKKRGVGPSMRGRHKKGWSRETRIWNRRFLSKSLGREEPNTESSQS